jgi:hypothetical protein
MNRDSIDIWQKLAGLRVGPGRIVMHIFARETAVLIDFTAMKPAKPGSRQSPHF